mmetsp:Transcript_99734/g.321553  ORF Transcript_99734/g.321553 Transcript_99734/m.321553 type:complete len:216 (+) Transcript_99734:2373-3020(+)
MTWKDIASKVTTASSLWPAETCWGLAGRGVPRRSLPRNRICTRFAFSLVLPSRSRSSRMPMRWWSPLRSRGLHTWKTSTLMLFRRESCMRTWKTSARDSTPVTWLAMCAWKRSRSSSEASSCANCMPAFDRPCPCSSMVASCGESCTIRSSASSSTTASLMVFSSPMTAELSSRALWASSSCQACALMAPLTLLRKRIRCSKEMNSVAMKVLGRV